MRSYPSPFLKGVEYNEIRNMRMKNMPPGYKILSHDRFVSTKHAKDLAVDEGTSVLAIGEGTIVTVKNDSDRFMNPKVHPRYEILFRESNLGAEEIERLGTELFEFSEKYTNYVQVNQRDGCVAEYVHLGRNVPVKTKQKIKQGDVVGFVGMTGLTDRPHLHLNIFENISVSFKLVKRV